MMDNQTRSAISELKDEFNELMGVLEPTLGPILEMWTYLAWRYDYQCDMPANTDTKPYHYTENLLEGTTTIATKVTTFNADGSITELYDLPNSHRRFKLTYTDNRWTGKWGFE